ncbi:MAG: ATP-binding protein, partial [Anaerolineales bacterium]|nr:ATP-binding protein [Anaerolineales bacterium]
ALPAEEQTDVLNDLVSESDRLIRLVNDLLVLARADAGQNLSLETISLQTTINEAVRQAGQLDPQREIYVTVPELSALGYRDALKQVLLIVLDNALKYTLGSLAINARLEAEGVVIEIQDSGPGIDSESLAQIFDRFYRGEVKPAIPGFGLGLPIAKALVESQQGRISLTSDRQAGSLVQIFLKAA